MSSPLIIRSVASTDFAQWEKLWEGYNSFYGRKGETALPDEITRMTWSRFFDAYEPVHALVAEKDGQLLGLVHYIFHRSTIMIGPICYLQDLFTAESARGQGVGRALIESVYERSKFDLLEQAFLNSEQKTKTMIEEYSAFLRGKIVAICEAILNEEIGVIAGSRRLNYLRCELELDRDEDFLTFVAINSETDHLPVDSERRHWSVEALERKDKEIAESEAAYKDHAIESCKKLIARFDLKSGI